MIHCCLYPGGGGGYFKGVDLIGIFFAKSFELEIQIISSHSLKYIRSKELSLIVTNSDFLIPIVFATQCRT